VEETGVSEVLARSLLVKFGWNQQVATQKFLNETAEGIFDFKFADKT
jgi:hypothetical protein